MSIGSRIKELRLSKNMTREQLADKLNVSVSAISNYENDISSPKEPILFAIIDALGCDANYLFQDSIKIPSNDITQEEMDFICMYRYLDKHGKTIVDFVVNEEYKRMALEKYDIEKQIDKLREQFKAPAINIKAK